MNTAFLLGDQSYESMRKFMSLFLTNALKDNGNITRSYVTGVSRLSKGSMFSGLNNLRELGLDSPILKSSFGFTTEEVSSLLDTFYRIKFPEPTNPEKINEFKEDIKKKKKKSFFLMK